CRFLKNVRIKLLIPAVLALTVTAFGQAWSGVLDPSRAADWTLAGAGPIPIRTTICTTLGAAGQLPGFAQSVTQVEIKAAIQSCGNNQVVFLNPGTYNLTTHARPSVGPSFAHTSKLTLRG